MCIRLQLARVFLNSEGKIAAFLDTRSLFAWDAGTKHLTGCKWVIAEVYGDAVYLNCVSDPQVACQTALGECFDDVFSSFSSNAQSFLQADLMCS